ncbi:hypothetical protein [Sphingomonas ginkgonis]|nr:hypothetical protein [Sphingomonas ginkgonis]
MQPKLILDFDGVLFNSAYEAYCVCNRHAETNPGLRDDVGFDEFMRFRAVLTDAWQFNRLYSREHKLCDPAKLPQVRPEAADWAYAEGFFAARAEMMKDESWPKLMAPYDFFFLLRPTLRKYPDKFAILSTRNVESIRRTLAFFDADVIPVFGQEDIRREGSKVEVARSQGWLEPGKFITVYVDDMNAHLEPFDGRVYLPLHANWGYDQVKDASLNSNQVLKILCSMLKLSAAA